MMLVSDTPRASSRGVFVFALLVALAATACVRPPRERVGSGSDEGYPTCDGRPLPEGEVIATGTLRAGPVMLNPSLVERFEVLQRGCVRVFRGNQSWDVSVIDLDVVYDAESGLPLRAWKRIVSPGPRAGDERVDIRRFELRTPRVALTQSRVTGELEHFLLRGERPRAVIGPGRGLITMWLQRARLPVGGRLREPVLDIRESIEVVREVTLRRLEDRDDRQLGRVRVYTIYGREPIYADENDVVVGDMMGLVPAALVTAPAPTPLFRVPGPPDPVHTP